MGGSPPRAGALTLLLVGCGPDREGMLELLDAAPLPGVLAEFEESIATLEQRADEGEELEAERWEETLHSEPPLDPNVKMRTTAEGAQALTVALALKRWLRRSPSGPLDLGPAGLRAIIPLAFGWSLTLVHALAREPQAAAQLREAAPALDPEVVNEYLETMRQLGQLDARSGEGEPRYAMTDWMREAIAPLIASVGMECRFPHRDTLLPEVLDVEAAFQMALPLVQLPPGLRGSCRLGVQIPGGEPLMAGATVEVAQGAVASISPLLDEDPETWVTGSPLGWCETVIDPSAEKLHMDGDTELTGALLTALRERLFGGEGSGPPRLADLL